jgi:hypothetical protein
MCSGKGPSHRRAARTSVRNALWVRKTTGLKFGHFPGAWDWVGQVFGPTGHESLAQGLPWEKHPKGRSPEGVTRISGYVPRHLVSGRPFRASGIKPKTQGKPWARFFSPFGPGNHAQHLTNFTLDNPKKTSRPEGAGTASVI